MLVNSRKLLFRIGLWFFILNILLVFLCSVRYYKHIVLADSFLTVLYLISTIIGHFAVLPLFFYLVLYVPIVSLFPKKIVARITGIVIMTAGLLVMIIDSFVFDLYRFHINKFTLELLFGGAAGQIFEFRLVYKIIALIAIIGLGAVEYWIFGLAVKINEWKQNLGLKYLVIVFTGFFLISQVLFTWAEAACYKRITSNSRIFPLYITLSASDFLHKYGIVDFDKSRVRLERVADNKTNMHYPLQSIKIREHTNKNILIILLDSWYYKVFDSLSTPHIKSFADSSMLFTNHYSGSNGTRTAVFSIFYSLPGTLWYDVLSSATGPVIIDQLINQNYKFGVFASASLVNPPFDRTVFCKLKEIDRKMRKGDAPERDKTMTTDWLAFINQYVESDEKKPFFGFLFYDGLHSMIQPEGSKAPFQPAWEYPQYERLNKNFDCTEFLNLYKNIAYFEDSLVNVVLNDLKKKGLFENTVIILTGDHGQEFNDNKKNYWGHNGNFSRAQVGVPYIMYWKEKGQGVFNHWTSHYDIVPTLMEQVLGCTNPVDDYSMGKSLFDTTKLSSLIVGSYDNFAIIDSATITNVFYDGSYEVTDLNLNLLEEQIFNTRSYDLIFRKVNRYNH